MLKLNIISPTLKKEIKSKALFRSVNRLALIVFASVVFYSLLFFTAKITMQRHYNALVNNETGLSRGQENYILSVKEINEKIENIEHIQSETIAWSYLVEKIYALVPAGIQVQRLSSDKEKSTLSLGGQAKDRDSLLLLKSELEKSGLFKNVELPIQSLLSKTNIKFDIALSFENYEFK